MHYTFSKGHATLNDFVIIEDQHGMQDLDAAVVRQLCDRRGGIGGDGLLRVVRAQHMSDWDGEPDLWFMDYRNADGSVAEMCGNGLRLFAQFLIDEQLIAGPEFPVATRAGVKQVRLVSGGLISANLGPVHLGGEVEISHDGSPLRARAVDVGNPHAVAVVEHDTLHGLDLQRAPSFSTDDFPDGVNVEFVHEAAPGDVHMRVHERGSGETMSCGTGVVATAAVHRQRTGTTEPIRVTVPGGDLLVEFDGDDAWLTGPAVITIRGEYAA